jgi:hypothetical protein
LLTFFLLQAFEHCFRILYTSSVDEIPEGELWATWRAAHFLQFRSGLLALTQRLAVANLPAQVRGDILAWLLSHEGGDEDIVRLASLVMKTSGTLQELESLANFAGGAAALAAMPADSLFFQSAKLDDLIRVWDAKFPLPFVGKMAGGIVDNSPEELNDEKEIVSPQLVLDWSRTDLVRSRGFLRMISEFLHIHASTFPRTILGQLPLVFFDYVPSIQDMLRSQRTPPGGNLLNSVMTGGKADVVVAAGLDGATNYQGASLGTSPADTYHPRPALCDHEPTRDDPNMSTQLSNDIGATWANPNPGTSRGVLLIDCSRVVEFALFTFFQMFADGKVTHVRLFSHPDTGRTVPAIDDSRWKPLSPDFLQVGAGFVQAGVGHPCVRASCQLELDKPVATRWLRLEAKNDGAHSQPGYIEIRCVKGFGPPDTTLEEDEPIWID